jgi:hypothetical protein
MNWISKQRPFKFLLAVRRTVIAFTVRRKFLPFTPFLTNHKTGEELKIIAVMSLVEINVEGHNFHQYDGATESPKETYMVSALDNIG